MKDTPFNLSYTTTAAGQQRVYNSSYIPAAALRQCNTTRHATTVSQWSTQIPNLATNFAQRQAGPQPHHLCSRRQHIQYNPSIHPAVRSMSPRVRTRRQGSSGHITRGMVEVRVGGGGSGRAAVTDVKTSIFTPVSESLKTPPSPTSVIEKIPDHGRKMTF